MQGEDCLPRTKYGSETSQCAQTRVFSPANALIVICMDAGMVGGGRAEPAGAVPAAARCCHGAQHPGKAAAVSGKGGQPQRRRGNAHRQLCR